MALPASLVPLILLLGADPGAEGDPYGPLRGPASDQAAAPQEIAEPANFPPPIHNIGGWAVGDAEPRPLAVEGPAEPIAEEPKPSALKLAPPSKTQKKGPADSKPPSSGGAITSVVSSLAVVLGLFFLVTWLAKRNAPKGAMLLPAEVVEVLGRTPLNARHQMHLVRFGHKLLLVSLTPAGAEPLAEIEDPAEVERLTGICQELQQGSISETFRHVFSQFANEPAREGFAGASQE